MELKVSKWLPKGGFAPTGQFVNYFATTREAIKSVMEANIGNFAIIYNSFDITIYRNRIPNDQTKLEQLSEMSCALIRFKEKHYTITQLTDGREVAYEVDLNLNNCSLIEYLDSMGE